MDDPTEPITAHTPPMPQQPSPSPPPQPHPAPSDATTNAAPMVIEEDAQKESEVGTGETENQNQLPFAIKQEPASHIMNQSNPSTLLPSFSFPPLSSSPSLSSPPLVLPPPLSSLAPSLFPPAPSSSSSSSTSSSSLPAALLSPPLSPSMSPHLQPRAAAPTPLGTSPSSWEQQTLARLNSLTQMTSQIASIALEKTAVKSETAVQEEDKPDSVVEWVTNISRSLQTELQSVYLTLHGGAEQVPMPVSPLPSLPIPPLSPSLPVQAEMVPNSLLPPPVASEEFSESKKGRRRRKTKTKDSFNHMQRKCASCQRTDTTKWRHGPLGSNTLCNTCGLAYSRKKKREAEQAAKLSATTSPPP